MAISKLTGKALDLGTDAIQSFASTGIDDNATSTQLTITDSGIAATLTTASQPNITSVGTLTGFTSTGIDDNATNTAITIAANNNVGIGETSPSYLLDLKGGTNSSIRLNALSGTFIFANGSGLDKGSIAMIGGNMNISADAGINFYSAGSPLSGDSQVVISTDGRLGVGVSAPESSLHVDTAIRVSGAVPTLQIHETDGANNQNYQLRVVNGDLKIQTNDDAFAAAVTVATLDTNGNLGIGTDTPLAVNGGKVLEVESATGSEIIIGNSTTTTVGGEHIGGFLFKNSDTSADQNHYAGLVAKAHDSYGSMDLEFYAGRDTYETSGTPHLFINGETNNAGYIGINTTSPQHFLDINVGNASPPTHKGHLRLSGGNLGNSGHGGIEFTGSTFGSGYGWRIQNEDPGGQTPLVIYSRENSTTWTEVARFRGSAVGGGIAFNGDTTAANALDDYEEGTYTAYLYDASTGGNQASPGRTGYYTKIGRKVTVSFYGWNNIDTTGLTAGNVVYIDLPFASGADGRHVGVVNHHGWTYAGSGSGRTSIMPQVTQSSSRFYFIANGNGLSDINVVVSDISSGADDIVTLSLTYHV